MVFGEIVIPSSRSLWDDDFTELTSYTQIPFKWDDNSTPNPIKINTLIIIETKSIIEIFKQCVIEKLKPVKKSTEKGLILYNLKSSDYLLIYENKPNYNSGEVLNDILDIIDNSSVIYGITSKSIAMFQGNERLNEDISTVFALTNEVDVNYRKLPIPNFITGICADLLTYCLCKGKKCGVFIGFLDTSLDSINTENLIGLIRSLGVENVKRYALKISSPENNLYM